MAAPCTVVVVTLLVLAAGTESRDPPESQLEGKIYSALRGISQALEHFENSTVKTFKFHKQNSDILHQSLRILRQNGEALMSLWRLPSNIKDELKEQHASVIQLIKNATDNVENLSRDNERLKIHLENKEKEAHLLQKELHATKDGNKELLSKVEELETSLGDSAREVEELREREKILNKTVTSQNQLLEDIHPLVVQRNVTRQVAEYDRTKKWKVLRKGLEAVLDREGLAYRQLRNVSYDDESPMWTVGFLGYEELAAVLLSGGQGPDTTDAEGCTLLHGAAQGGQLRLAAELLNRGAAAEARGGHNRWTALVYAARWDRLPVVKLLKERGAELNAATGDGETALHWAAWEGHVEVVRYLVAAGASTTARNHWGRTPLENARLHGQTVVVEYLSQFPH